jgi:hypothetical protein
MSSEHRIAHGGLDADAGRTAGEQQVLGTEAPEHVVELGLCPLIPHSHGQSGASRETSSSDQARGFRYNAVTGASGALAV